MISSWSEAKDRVSHRLALHLCVTPFQLLNKTPMVSFTFDDIPKSAATLGAEMLSQFDANGTFYIAGGLVNASSPHWFPINNDDIIGLHSKGHEIACHTFTHTRVCDLGEARLNAEIENNRKYLQAVNPSIKIENFAYPYGVGSFRRKGQLKTAFRSCRGIMAGVNSGTVDLQYLRATPLVQQLIDGNGIEHALDVAQAVNGWLIFYTHDIDDEPSPYGCSPALLRYALDAVSRRKIPILNMTEALSCARA